MSPDNPELRVVRRIPRSSGSTTYVLNAIGPGGRGVTTVLHSKHGSFVCLNSTCGGWWKADRQDARPCEHTRCAMQHYALMGDDDPEDPTDSAGGHDVADPRATA